MCYSLLPIMLKIFDLMKNVYFSHFSRILPLQVRQSLFTITLNNLQLAVFRQRSIFFNRAGTNKSTISVLCLNFFGHV